MRPPWRRRPGPEPGPHGARGRLLLMEDGSVEVAGAGTPIRADLPREGRFRVVAGPERDLRRWATGALDSGALSADTGRAIVGHLLDRAHATPEQREAVERYAEADPGGAVQQALDLLDGGVAAAAPRPPRDGEALVASAVRAGKFSEARADYWRGRLAEDFDGAARVIAALAAPSPAPGPRRLSDEQEAAAHDGYMSRFFPQAHLANGNAVTRPNPLGAGAPTVREPGAGVRHIRDGSH